MKYLVTVYQEYESEDDKVTLEVSRFIRCRLSTARKICKEVFEKLTKQENTMLCVAVWRDDRRVFLMTRQGE